MSLHPSQISSSDFQSALSCYPALIKSLTADKGKGKSKATDKSLEELDQYRLVELPQILADRQKESRGKGWLEMGEVEMLIRWKLKHGKFRPTLLSLLASNSPSTILSTTRTAFSTPSPTPTSAELLSSLDTLSSLRGIGPASASLLLSIAFPAEAPFYSDEAYRWVTWDEGVGGWGKKLKYDKKEYGRYLEGVGGMRERLGVGAREVEIVGFVLGKEGVEIGQKDGEVKKGKAAVKESKPKAEVTTPASKKRAKVEKKEEQVGSRRSKRSKKGEEE